MTLADAYRLSARYSDDHGTVFMTGLQALARLPIEQLRADQQSGLRTAAFISGYPGSPLGGYDSELKKALGQAGEDLPIILTPALNEEQAATAVMGSQLAATRPTARHDGVLGIFYGKGPGVDRAGDAIRHGVFAGAHPCGGAVVIAGDDPLAKSSTIPSSSAGTLADMHIPVLYPGTPGEALDLGRHAVHLSRSTGLWTSLKVVSDVADGSGTVHLDPSRVQPRIPTIDGEPYIHMPNGRLLTPATVDTEREIYEIRHPLAIEYAALNRLNHATVNPHDAWIGIVASGITYREVREALRRLGLQHDADIAAAGIRLMCMHMPLPFSPKRARDFARGLEEVLVVEEKNPNIESLVKDALYNETLRPRVTGKFDEHDVMLIPGHGGLDADELLGPLRRRLAQRIGARLAPEQHQRQLIPINSKVARTPYFCSGCPHNRSTRVPDGAVVGAGIGCHTMTLLMDSDDFGDIIGLTCMGQEGTQWIGMAPFVDTPHIFQNIGDGTFFHSGQLAIQGAVAAGINITYKVLWNQTVAMTGGQDPRGAISVGDVARMLLAQGVARVLVTTEDTSRYRGHDLPDGVAVWPRERMLEAQELLAGIEGVTVLVHDQQCAAEARRARKKGTLAVPRQRVVVNDRICEGCGDCASVSNCLSVQPTSTPFGRKTRIDQTSCNLDFSCLEGDCPAFMTVTLPGRLRSRLRRLTRRSRTRDHKPPRDFSDQTNSSISSISSISSVSSNTAVTVPGDLPEPVPCVPTDAFSLRLVGIGGTGVVTVSQIIGTAAMFDGYEVSGLDQIGLSQKAGPVVSDLRLNRHSEAASNHLGAKQADTLLAFDQLGAASRSGTSRCDPARTVVVGSTSVTPTGAVIAHPERDMPHAAGLEAAIAEVTRPDCRHWADAQHITTALLGNAVTANVFVVGMAVQAGALPLAAESVEQAIKLNGVAVSGNIAAFRWGRVQVARPEVIAAAVRSTEPSRDHLPVLDTQTAGRVQALEAAVDAMAEAASAKTGDTGASVPTGASVNAGPAAPTGTAAPTETVAPTEASVNAGASMPTGASVNAGASASTGASVNAGAAVPTAATGATAPAGSVTAEVTATVGAAMSAATAAGTFVEEYRDWSLEVAARELCAYQSPRLARRFLDFVEEVASADATNGDGSGRLTVACARGYFKLLAYKDEYEVARLMLDAAATAEARQLAEATGGRLAWKLHPPVLRALGLSRKITVPYSFAPLFRLLAALRFVRGTPLDVFGYTKLRRVERSLAGEYRAAVQADLRHLHPTNYEQTLERARLPEVVRGYEHIKMAGVDQLRQQLNNTASTTRT